MQYRSKVACIFLLGFFIDCINIFMSAIAFPAMSTLFQLTQVEAAWISNSYILGLCLIIPMSIGLANLFNTRRVLLGSTAIFALSSFMVGSADSFNSLVIWRFIQGLSGGLIIPVGQALTFNLYQGNDRVKISTLIMMTALIAPALSPMLGGWVIDISSWRWVFYSHLPMILLLLLLIYIWLKPEQLGT
ncbi:MFS transporter, partial [Acinetobacter rudis]